MKKVLVFALSGILTLLAPSLAYAGEYVWGATSANDDRAMKSAFTLAESRVRSRGKGCVGRGVNDTTTENLIVKEKGDVVQYGVFISHHNGSCNIKKNVIENISRETGIDVNKLVTAWIAGG